jgi:nucleoid-associated protein YgaU
MFPVTSRYHNVQIAKWRAVADGPEIAYLRRRFLPPATQAAALAEHTVADGERLDHVAARYLGDPEQFWRLCDANEAMRPEDLIAQPGRRLRIPQPQEG